MAVMYRRGVFSLYPRGPALSALSALPRSPDATCTLPPCRHPLRAPALRVVVQVSRRAFSSTRVFLCEKENRTSPPLSTDVKKNEERTEEPQAESKRSETIELDQKTEHRTKAVSGGSGSEPAEGLKPTNRTQDNKTSGKKGLLELLGAMKVEVTTKRKIKSPKIERGAEPPPKPEEMESTTSMFQQATSEAAAHRESLSADLVAAASAVASTLPDSNQAKSDLLRQLRKHEAISQEHRNRDTHDIGNIIADMKVGRRLNGRQNTRSANQIRFDEDGRGYTHDRGITGELDELHRRTSPFLARRLNIFPAGEKQETDTDLAAGPSLWDADLASQIVQVVNQQPRNGFEEMIQWTREGRLWQYPIDNEAGMEEEASVPFHKHVFLESHLEDGFPQHGPVRHFMELVVTGLSKNHQLTVQQKLEHIAWFREYFQQKQDVLKEAEAY